MQDLDAVQIPWSLVGLLLLNFVEALAVGAAFHPSLQPIQRLENALTAYALLDLGRMLASETAAQEGCSVSSRWKRSSAVYVPNSTHHRCRPETIASLLPKQCSRQ